MLQGPRGCSQYNDVTFKSFFWVLKLNLIRIFLRRKTDLSLLSLCFGTLRGTPLCLTQKQGIELSYKQHH